MCTMQHGISLRRKENPVGLFTSPAVSWDFPPAYSMVYSLSSTTASRIGHDGGDIIRRNGLHQNRWKPNRLPFSRQLGDATHELEELRSTHDRVRNRGSLDQIFLGHLCAEVTTRKQA